jgi:opacity protein-like surface antigen
MALLAIPAATTFSQDMGGSDSGIYFDVGGGLAIVPEIAKAKGGPLGPGVWFEKDGKAFYYEDGTKKSGTPTLKEIDLDAGFDLGWTAGGALGYQFGDIRAEAEVTYTSANQNKSGSTEGEDFKDPYDTLPSLNILSFMANGWYEIDTGTMFSPFIGLGLGGFHGVLSGGKPKNAGTDFKVKESAGWGFAVQGGAGVAVEVADGLSIQLGYRLFWAPLETTYTHESTDKQDLALAKASLGADADKVITGVAFPLMVHRIELGVSYLLPL